GAHVDVFYDPANMQGVSPPNLRLWLSNAGIDVSRDSFYPFLMSANHRPASINVATLDDSKTPLGTRATLSVTLGDAASNDREQDKYYIGRFDGSAQANGAPIDPNENGTFFTKYLARNKYLEARKIVWITGHVQDRYHLASMVKREFVITEVGGVSIDGVLQIRAQDPLYLAGFKHAMIPRPSEIQLYKDLPADQYGTMSAQEWAEYGFDQIPTPDADNRAYFTLGDDLAWINPETKGVYRKPEHQGGRSPSDQSAGTTIQRAYNPTGRELALTPKTIRIDDLLKDILLNYTDISKLGAGIINNPQWSSFLGRYPWLERSYNFIITEPQPVLDTLSQIAEQTLFFVYWDERTASIHLGASLAATADFLPQLPLLDEFANFLQGSLDIKKVSNSVHTRIYINHSVLGWTDEYDK